MKDNEDIYNEYTSPPPEDFSYLPPPLQPRDEDDDELPPDYSEFLSLDDPETKKKLEAKMIQTFLGIMEDGKSAPTHRLSAAKEIGELLGKYTKAAVITNNAENVQNNLLSDPDKAKALLGGIGKARSVADGTDSGVKPLEGGKGA